MFDASAVESFRLLAGRVDLKPPQRDEVHVWSIRLRSQELDPLQGILSGDELERASKFHFEKHRRSYIDRRAILRVLLASYLDIEPTSIRFSQNEYGKPSLEMPRSSNKLRFNLSHSGELVRIAISVNREVGIDIEQLDESIAIESVARNFFSPREVATLVNLPKALKLTGFFSCWTRKEAYIKARGMGLSIPLKSFDVAVEPGGSPNLISDVEPSKVWKVVNIENDPRYCVSLAASGSSWKAIHQELEI